MIDEVQRRFIEITLEELEMVKWDRYVAYPANWAVYGWIDRADATQDFVVVEFAFRPSGIDVWFVTSSAAHTDEIAAKLGVEGDDHNKCQPVSNIFPSLPTVPWVEKGRK